MKILRLLFIIIQAALLVGLLVGMFLSAYSGNEQATSVFKTGAVIMSVGFITRFLSRNENKTDINKTAQLCKKSTTWLFTYLKKISNKISRKTWLKIAILVVFVLIGSYLLLFKASIDREESKKSVTLTNSVIMNDSKEILEEKPMKYRASALLIGGLGSTITQLSAQYVDIHGYLLPAEDWATVSFNTPKDIMTLMCRDGYDVSSCSSGTQNSDVFINDVVGCRMIVENKMQNRIDIECSKKE